MLISRVNNNTKREVGMIGFANKGDQLGVRVNREKQSPFLPALNPGPAEERAPVSLTISSLTLAHLGTVLRCSSLLAQVF